MTIIISTTSFFWVEALILFLLGAIISQELVSPLLYINLRCALFTMAIVAIVSMVYTGTFVKRKVKASKNINIDNFGYNVTTISCWTGLILFVVLSLIFGGPDGGVVEEIIWFVRTCLIEVVIFAFACVSSVIGVKSVERKCKKRNIPWDTW